MIKRGTTMKKKYLQIEIHQNRAIEIAKSIIKSEDLEVNFKTSDVESMGSRYISVTGDAEEVDLFEEIYNTVYGYKYLRSY